jgi:hypothetical protein
MTSLLIIPKPYKSRLNAFDVSVSMIEIAKQVRQIPLARVGDALKLRSRMISHNFSRTLSTYLL